MQAYIDIVGSITQGRYKLTASDLRLIGAFTRENIEKWINNRPIADWSCYIAPVEDFHAVCGDIEIPWADERHSKYRIWSEPIEA